MTAELSGQPSKEEFQSYRARQLDHIKKIAISGVVGIASAGASSVFPAAIGGTYVGLGGAVREFALFHKDFYQFHKRYPSIDKIV